VGFLTDEHVSNSPDETYRIGLQLAKYLLPGSVVALEGTLGSGKTCLTKGIAFGLGITESITSPTYTIINEYSIPPCNNLSEEKVITFTLYHIDVYRLKGDRDFEEIGGLEIINSDGIAIIEWSEKIPESLPHDKITVTFDILDTFSRLIHISGLSILEKCK